VFLQWIEAGTDVNRAASSIETGTALRETIAGALATAPSPPTSYSGRVDSVTLTDENTATVHFVILLGNVTVLDRSGAAVRINGQWVVSRETYCGAIAVGPTRCPPG
jgi:hypothetical protein